MVSGRSFQGPHARGPPTKSAIDDTLTGPVLSATAGGGPASESVGPVRPFKQRVHPPFKGSVTAVNCVRPPVHPSFRLRYADDAAIL